MSNDFHSSALHLNIVGTNTPEFPVMLLNVLVVLNVSRLIHDQVTTFTIQSQPVH